MRLQKIFSNNQDNERLYTVLMNDDEMKLYGEFQREFARRDYEGLTSEQAKDLKAGRDWIAKTIKENRKEFRNKINGLKDSWDNLKPGKGIYTHGGAYGIVKESANTPFSSAYNTANQINNAEWTENLPRWKKEVRQGILDGDLKRTPNFLQRNKGKLAIGAGLTAGALATAAYLKNKQKDKEE